MIIFVDIDKTICIDTNGHYGNAKPLVFNIEKINKLFDAGHTIVYWSSRGATTGINWIRLTKRQFGEWGVKYHQLRLDKPFFDKFIDDKSLRIEEIDDLGV